MPSKYFINYFLIRVGRLKDPSGEVLTVNNFVNTGVEPVTISVFWVRELFPWPLIGVILDELIVLVFVA